jgi:eukaryotic-like serine/threonine-protein kinase
VNPERWRQIERIYHAALSRSPSDREAFLKSECSGDERLRVEIESLLSRDASAERFLNHPVTAIAASLTEPHQTDLVGRRLGIYEVQARIGAGGMGVVYRALDTNLKRPVAIKVLSEELAGPAARRRFESEARTVSSLNHPHILTVHDAGAFDERQYLVTEFIDGETLDKWARSERRSWREIVELLAGVADGLAAAHEAGITHRDIKPANILVARNGYAKLADFGLAKLVSPATALDPTIEGGTRAGVILGTMAYMAPEQAAGGATDSRSDIFSFGVVLYELLAGRRPFNGSTDLELLETIIHGTPRPLAPEVPVALRSVIEKALEKDAANRYQSMRDVVIELRRLIRQSGETTAFDARQAHGWRWPLLVAVLLASVGILVLLPFRQPGEPPRLEYTQLTNFADSVVNPALSPDGRLLSFIRSEETFWGFGEVYVKQLPDGEPVQLTRDGLRKVGPPVFSPDGARVAYTVDLNGRDWETWAVPVLGGQPRRLLANATALTWIEVGAAPPGVLFAEWLLAAPRMSLFTATERRADQRRIYLPEDVNGMVHRAYLSPDKAWVLLIEMDASGWLPCRVLPFDGSSQGRLVGPMPGQCTDAAWSPDGQFMYFSASTGRGFHIWRQRFPAGVPVQVTSGASEEEGVALAPDGKSFVTSIGTSQSTLWLHDVRGDRQITAQGFPVQPSFSADGTRLYYLSSPTTQPFVSVNAQLWTANVETGQLERVLPDSLMEHYNISDDGKRVVFITREETGRSSVRLAPLDATAAPRILTSLDSLTAFFGSNGDVFFAGGEGTIKFLYRIKEDGSGLQKVTPRPVKVIYDVSPDGNWVAAWSGRAAVIYPTSGGGPVTVCPACANRAPPNQPALVRWSRNGKFLYLHETGLRLTYALPLRPGEMLPSIPSTGIMSPMAAAALPDAHAISEQRAFGGASPSIYAFPRVTTHRNVYRIPVP